MQKVFQKEIHLKFLVFRPGSIEKQLIKYYLMENRMRRVDEIVQTRYSYRFINGRKSFFAAIIHLYIAAISISGVASKSSIALIGLAQVKRGKSPTRIFRLTMRPSRNKR